MNNKRPKTLFIDIDGTLIIHKDMGVSNQLIDGCLIPGTLEKFTEWDMMGYNIILTTGRRESHRQETEKMLKDLGLFYDKLIMGIGGGDRVLINDRKPNSECDTAYAINVDRNEGVMGVKI